MKHKRCNFESNDLLLGEQNADSQFATLEFDVCRSGENTHRMPIPRNAIKNAALSIKGKPVLASFAPMGVDFEGHEVDEQAIGFFVEEEPQVIEKEWHGKKELFLRAKGKIWKRYFGNAMDIFKRKGGKTDVSMEIDMIDFAEPEGAQDGYINEFSITGCTLLGVSPAIHGAEARVLTFSEMKDEYNKEMQKSNVQQFISDRRMAMSEISYKINKTELKDAPWGDVDKTAMRNKIMKAINKATLVKAVYALVEDGWEDAPSEHLKYPIMQLVGDTFYYNRNALASALAYAKQENEREVIKKIEGLYKKFKLNNEGGDDEGMSEKKKKVLSEEQEQDNIVMNDEQMQEDAEEMCDKKLEDEQMEDSADFEDNDEQEVKRAKEDLEPDDDDAEGSDSKAEEFGDEQTGEMALDVNNYAGAMLEMLRAENDAERDAAYKLGMCGNAKMEELATMCYNMCKEMAALKTFKCDVLKEKTEFAVSQILAEVKQDLPTDKYAELEEKSKSCAYEDVDQFRITAQAFAYQHGVSRAKPEDDGHLHMTFGNVGEQSGEYDVFADILGK